MLNIYKKCNFICDFKIKIITFVNMTLIKKIDILVGQKKNHRTRIYTDWIFNIYST